MPRIHALLVPLFLVASACGGTSLGTGSGSGSGSGASAPSCSTSADCPTGQRCGYLIADGCDATAQCLPEGDWGLCDSIESACACSGETVTLSGCAEAASEPIQKYPGGCS